MPKTSTKTLVEIVRATADFLESELKDASPNAIRMYTYDFNALLDSWSDDDAFGTEGQLDPRGDQRN